MSSLSQIGRSQKRLGNLSGWVGSPLVRLLFRWLMHGYSGSVNAKPIFVTFQLVKLKTIDFSLLNTRWLKLFHHWSSKEKFHL